MCERLIMKFLCAYYCFSHVATGSSISASAAPTHFSRTLSSSSPLNSYHNPRRAHKACERMILFRNHSLKRSLKKISNESYFTYPHHCTIELKTKAASCLHLLNKTQPVVLSTFRNQSDQGDDDDQKKNNELLWRYQFDISKKNTSHSQCNLNIHHSHKSNAVIGPETMNPLENKTML